MNDIKFRGKRKDNREWVEGYYFKDDFRNKSFIIPILSEPNEYLGCNLIPGIDFVEVIPESVGMFTGLRDKKRTKAYPVGKEIYEGDIVEITSAIDMFNDDGTYSMHKGEVYETCIVQFYQGAFWLGYANTLIDKHLLRMILNDSNWRGEIIGNQLENPKLCEGK